MAALDAGEIKVPEDDEKHGKYVVSDPNAHLALSPTVGVVVRNSSRPSPPHQTPPDARTAEAGDEFEPRD
eukprot:689764-Pleurochrysis_carterae.AAC.3